MKRTKRCVTFWLTERVQRVSLLIGKHFRVFLRWKGFLALKNLISIFNINMTLSPTLICWWLKEYFAINTAMNSYQWNCQINSTQRGFIFAHRLPWQHQDIQTDKVSSMAGKHYLKTNLIFIVVWITNKLYSTIFTSSALLFTVNEWTFLNASM